MTSAVHVQSAYDQTNLTHVLRRAALLGLLQAGLVLAFSLASRFLDGLPELVIRSVIVLAGVAATTLLPGLWTRARSVEGIAGAAGIGLGATVVFTLVDSVLLQWIGTYTNRWLEIGGGSNWWYLPVWWMVGTYLSWMGAFALANQTAKRDAPAPGVVLGLSLVLTAICGALGVALGVPHASLNLGTFSVAFLPAIALTVVVTGMGVSRS
jgi:hypothetical protein